MRIFRQINELCNNLLDLVDSEINLEQRLNILQFIASIYWDNDSSTYFNYRLETILLKLSKEIINFTHYDINYKDNHVLHVMTKSHLVGGHTRVVDNWIKCLGGMHSVLLNNSTINEVPEFLKLTVTDSNGEIILNEGNTLVEKALRLFKVSSQYKYIVLHHHPDDILPLLAFGNDYFKRPIFLYNHADHVWGCGYSVADRILELSEFAAKVFSEKYRAIPKGFSINVSIPVNIDHSLPLRDLSDKKIVISMASAYKFKPVAHLNFQNFVSKLLDLDAQIKYAVIGVESNDPDWEQLKKHYGSRIIFHGVLEKDAANVVLLEAGLYVDSFPLGSSTSMIEAISLGLPALSLKTKSQNMDSYMHISVDTVSELIDKSYELLNLDNEAKQKVIKYNYEKIAKYHSFASFKEKILALDSVLEHKPIKLTTQTNIHDEFIIQYSGFISELLGQDALKLNIGYFSVNGLFSKISLRNQSIIAKLLTKFNLDSLWSRSKIYPLVYTVPLVQIFYASKGEEFSETKLITQVFDFTNSTYIFNLPDVADISRIRFDPVNIPCKIYLKRFAVTDGSGVEHKLTNKANNASEVLNDENYFTFYHNDPQLIYELPDSLSDKVTNCFIEMEVFNIIDTENISWTSEIHNKYLSKAKVANDQYNHILHLNNNLNEQLSIVNHRNNDLNMQFNNLNMQFNNLSEQLSMVNHINNNLNEQLSIVNSKNEYLQDIITFMENTIIWKIRKLLKNIYRTVYKN